MSYHLKNSCIARKYVKQITRKTLMHVTNFQVKREKMMFNGE